MSGRVNSGVDIRQPPRTTSHSCRTASTPPTSSKHNSIPLHSIEGGKSACLSLGNAQNSTVYMITSWVSTTHSPISTVGEHPALQRCWLSLGVNLIDWRNLIALVSFYTSRLQVDVRAIVLCTNTTKFDTSALT